MYMNEKLVLKSKKVKDHISAENLKNFKTIHTTLSHTLSENVLFTTSLGVCQWKLNAFWFWSNNITSLEVVLHMTFSG